MENVIEELLDKFIEDCEFIYDSVKEEYYIKLHHHYYKLSKKHLNYLDKRYDFYEYMEIE